ncbi:MAG: DUF3592 domain-containing protein [Lachnospiraceae bacterium]|nr:DUF3592 domain-containing protein [Lachnospiraceae bacterium]
MAAVIVLLILILGIIFIIAGSHTNSKNKRCSAQIEGVLAEIIHKPDAPDPYVYTYSVEGVEYKLVTTQRNPDVKNIGDHCTIWYNPSKPKEAVAYHYKSNKGLKILTIVGIVMVALVVILFIIIMIAATQI